jgi:ribosome-associated heat shock protein Hsp15
MSGVRIDKWLWAARFFKTRGKAKEAIDGGKVHLDGARVKPSKDIVIGQQLTIRQGFTEKTVVVSAISEQRRDATTAASLYAETSDSIAKRELLQAQRKAAGPMPQTSGRPTKKDRRLIHQFHENNID